MADSYYYWQQVLVYLVVAGCILSQPAHASAREDAQILLKNVLQWEILWEDTPPWFQTQSFQKITIAIQRTARGLVYCSTDLGGCAEYRVEAFRNPERLRNAPAKGMSNIEALIAFVGLPRSTTAQGSTPIIGSRGLSGAFVPSAGVMWSSDLSLEPREEIAKSYRASSHSPQTSGLETWIRSKINKQAGYRSIVVPCFFLSDPIIYLYGDREKAGPVVISVFWDREESTWIEAGLLEGTESSGRLEKLHQIATEIACTTVKLK